MRWLVLVYGGLFALLSVVLLPKEATFLRTTLAVAPTSIAIIVYLRLKYANEFRISADMLSSIGCLVQFLLPLVYLTGVELEGYYSIVLSGLLEHMPEAALLSYLGQCFFFIGYEMRAYHKKVDDGVQNGRRLEGMRPYEYLIIMSPIIISAWVSRFVLLRTGSYYHLIYSDFREQTPLYSLLAQLSSHELVVLAGLWICVLLVERKESKKAWRITALAFTIAELAWCIPSGSREPLLAVGLAIFMAYMYVMRRIRYRYVLIGTFALLLLLPFMDVFRYAIADIVEPSNIRTEVVGEAFETSRFRFYDEGYVTGNWLTSAMGRLADVRSVAVIMEGVPSRVPYLMGETYLRILWILVPRMVYPDKPELILPLGYGLETSRAGTSSPTTVYGEAYLNFGWIGVMLVLPILGFLSRLYDEAFVLRKRSLIWTAVYVGTGVMVFRLPVQPVATWLVTFVKAFVMGSVLTGWGKVLNAFGRREGERVREGDSVLSRHEIPRRRSGMQKYL